MVTAICNVYINSDVKFRLFKETFPLVYGCSDNWLVYIRGRFKEKVYTHIRETFPDYEKSCVFFEKLEDDHWPRSVLKMLAQARYDVVYVYLEDHFLMRPLRDLRRVIEDMRTQEVDFFKYTFFNLEIGQHNVEKLYPKFSEQFYVFDYSHQTAPLLKKEYPGFCAYPTSIIARRAYFQAYMESLSKKLVKVPFSLQVLMENVLFIYPRNRILWARLNRVCKRIGVVFGIYPTGSTFVGERQVWEADESFLPLKVGILREELFANWDDDNGLPHSCLIKRGLYPTQFRVPAELEPAQPGAQALHTYTLEKGERVNRLYYPDFHRVYALPVKYIQVQTGCLTVTGGKESYTLREGESLFVYSNIPHELVGVRDTEYQVWIGAQAAR